jgi:hypothetical protein
MENHLDLHFVDQSLMEDLHLCKTHIVPFLVMMRVTLLIKLSLLRMAPLPELAQIFKLALAMLEIARLLLKHFVLVNRVVLFSRIQQRFQTHALGRLRFMTLS